LTVFQVPHMYRWTLQRNMVVHTSDGFLNQVATIQNQNGEFRIEVGPMN
jgi:hypothetical protein